ncbi:hypothetical protein FOA52_001738 [Chlamydomonas sp. UWO 241]|nr:hypothetical protein FOA52_001738 [Chlamydomonas sp. UWO 241]
MAYTGRILLSLGRPQQIKDLRAALNCLFKIGSELLVEGLEDRLVLRSINTAKSAFFAVTFSSSFFDDYQVHGSEVVQSAVLLKHVLATFRTHKINRMTLDMDADQSMLTVTVVGENKITKTYHLECMNSEILNATVDKDSCPTQVIAEAGELNKLLSSFQSGLDEITIIANPENLASAASMHRACQLQSFYDPEKARSKDNLHTSLEVDTRSLFVGYQHRSANPSDVTFNVKDFRSMVALCEHMGVNIILSFKYLGSIMASPPTYPPFDDPDPPPPTNILDEEISRRISSAWYAFTPRFGKSDEITLTTKINLYNAFGKTSGGRQADPSNEQDAPVAALAAQAQASLAGFWGRERLTGLCTSLTEHLMLTQRDLEEWSVCPEGFFHACDDSAWAERSNLCAETLMLTLLTQHKVLLCPVVVHLLTAVSAECPTGATVGTMPGPRVCGLPAALLRKEAVYHAVSAAAYELHDYIDWGQWLRSSLLPELSDATPVMRPLRRRVAALVGDWVARVENVDRPALYRALVGCMSEADACLQLTAVSTLRSLVDDWNFSDEQFAEWVGPTMQLLVHMLKAADELDSQTASFNLMNLVIERMGDHIRPFVTPILQLMPQLWADAEGAPLVRIQVLLAMCRLVHTLGPESPACYALVLPPTSTSIDVSNPESLSLMEDGLALLLILLRNAPDAERGAPLLSLAPLLASAMAASTEHIRFGVAVLTSMVLLGGAPFMQAHGASVASVFTAFFGNVNERGMLLLFPAMELVLGAVPSVAPSVLQPALTRLLGLLMAGRESEVVTSNAMTVFARLLLISPAAFTQLLSDAAASGVSPPGAPPGAAASPEALLSALLDAWTDGFDSLASTRARKLCAVAMCRLLALPSPALLDALEPLLVCITGVWSELEGGADDGAAPSYGLEYSWSVGDDGGLEVVVVAASDEAEGECMRRRALSESDPVGHTAVSAALREGLSAAQAAHGQALHTRLAAMDGSIAAQQIKDLRAALNCLFKIGSELLVEGLEDRLVLRSINTAKSAFFAVTFSSSFFDDYQVHGSEVVQSAVLLKITKTYHLECMNSEILNATVDKDSCPTQVIAEAGELNKLLSSFQRGLDEITIIANPENLASAASMHRACQLQSFYDPEKARSKDNLHTSLEVDTRSLFVGYQHRSANPSDVTFNVKDFRSMVALCEHMGVNIILR